MNKDKIIIGAIAGFAADTLVGMLFAPEKGVVTRQNIAGMSEYYIDELKHKFQTYADKYDLV